MNAESSSSKASSPRPELILVLKVHAAEKARSGSSVLGLISIAKRNTYCHRGWKGAGAWR